MGETKDLSSEMPELTERMKSSYKQLKKLKKSSRKKLSIKTS